MFSFLKTVVKIAGPAGIGFCLLLWSPPAVPAGEPVVCRGRINAHRLNLRADSSLSARVVIILEKGDMVDVLGEKGGIGSWLKVRYENYEGFVKNRPRYITLLSPDSAEKPAAPPAPEPVVQEKTVKKVIRERKKIDESIRQEQDRITSFSEAETRIIEGLNEIDFALNRARVNTLSLAADIDELQGRIEEISAKKKALAAVIEENTSYTGQRLDALYRLNMIGRLEIAGTPKSVFDFFLKQNAMKRIIESDFDLIEKQTRDMARLAELSRDLEEQRRIKLDLESELSFQIRVKEEESKKKTAILKDIRDRKQLALAAVASLKDAAADLDDRIEQFRKKAEARTAGKPFSSYKGRLSMPVSGEIISMFGPSKSGEYGALTFQSGIDIRTERGEPVKCVFNGEVLFAEWLKGYGNVMIVNHGENFYSLYAHVEEIFKKPGEKVATGEVIATAGDTGSIKGLCLHFELRHHGKPVNPLEWVRKGA